MYNAGPSSNVEYQVLDITWAKKLLWDVIYGDHHMQWNPACDTMHQLH